MKIRMQFGPAKTAVIAVVAGVSLALIVLDSLLLGGVFGKAVNVPVASVSLAMGVIVLIASLTLIFSSKYIIGDQSFKGVFSFLYTMEIPYEAIISIRQNTITKQVFISATNSKGGMSTLTLNLTGEDADFVAKEIASKSAMLIDYYSPEKKK
ncbi:MAG: hypothetical protein J6V37_04865 [Clostridia bacterium]|nr:hypothetical protein [Clostridia bacterium]